MCQHGCECQPNVGPLPEGHYTLGDMFTFHGMPYCYELFPDSSNNMCGRSGFLIHGGGCSADPSEGCIVIEDQNGPPFYPVLTVFLECLNIIRIIGIEFSFNSKMFLEISFK